MIPAKGHPLPILPHPQTRRSPKRQGREAIMAEHHVDAAEENPGSVLRMP
jgi:hypothetical protein